MAEIFLSATINVLIEKLLSGDLIDFVRREGVHTSVKKWESQLDMIRDVLGEAEKIQIKEEARGVRKWLRDLRELAFDAEDVLDEITTEAKRRKLKAESEASSSKVPSLTIPSRFKPKAIQFNFTIKSKIEKITTRFQEIEEQKRSLNLNLNLNLLGNAGTMSNNARERVAVNPPTTSLEEPYVQGRDEDREGIVKLLLGGEASDDGLRVISIIAMGGAGKTTLARHVYNDDRVKASFSPRAWVCVSEDFEFVRVTKAMLDSFTDQNSGDNALELLQNRLKEKLSNQKFLLVLDDVWPENYKIDWTILSKPLMSGAPGSRIIVTTRNQDASSIMAMGTVLPYNLEKLSSEDTKAIFFHHALGTADPDAHPSLKEIGEKIVLERCKGSPLAAKALGGLLRTKVDPIEWEDVLHSQIWALPEEKCDIIPALRLSYHHLPPHLKPCFAYCSIYPKDYEFSKEELVLHWMATGLVQQQQGETKSMEKIGDVYFRDLFSRSFFQKSSIDESLFVMHDLINDLAQWAAGETCFRLENKKQPKDSKKVRHSSYTRDWFDGVKKFEAFREFESLRTFLSVSTPKRNSYLTRSVSLDLLFRCLRVLSLGGYCNTELPESIGNLKHLRHLDLSRSKKIRSLPRSTTTLYNLQTLILRDCSKLEMLPTEMGNLRDLRHLDITDANSIKEMPRQIGKLTSLRKLSDFIVGHDTKSAGLRELTNLKFLSGKLCISNLEKVMNVQHAVDAKLKDKQDLDVLSIKYSGEFNASRKERVEEEVLNMLEPPKKLTELYIKHYGGTTLPTWLGNPSFSEMVVLELADCIKCTSLPPLGQLPSLKDLCIQGMKEVKRVDIEFYGTSGCAKYFQSLKTMRFENMEEWKDWVDCFSTRVDRQVEAFPRLRELSIEKCPKLSGKLPDHLPSLEKLVISECPQLTVLISSHPKLYEIDIKHRQEVAQGGLRSLKSLVVPDISKLSCLTEGFVQGLTKVEDLKIVGCNELRSLWQKEEGLLQHLTSLCDCLKIKSCPEFVSLVTEEEIEQQQQRQPVLPLRLKSLELGRCENLDKLEGLHSLTSLKNLAIKRCPKLVALLEKRDNGSESLLEELRIEGCSSLTSLSSRGELPTTLKILGVWNCPKLEFVVERFHHNTFLEVIWIEACENLKSLPEGLHNLTRLSQLQISNCEKLRALPDCIHNLTSLQELRIFNCGGIVSFPNGGLPSPNLRRLLIWKCEKLEVLPCLQSLTSLQFLYIRNCPGIVSFPEEGFPTNLIDIEISNLKILDSIIDWGLCRLTSLKSLEIGGPDPDLVSFPEEDDRMMLPTSLTCLTIADFPNLKYLSSKAFQNLTSLEFLVIRNCPKLKFFPKKGLPLSLLQLAISGCPVLKQRCERDQGQDWPKIAHIPRVIIWEDDT